MKVVLDVSAIELAVFAIGGAILLCQSWEIQKHTGYFFGIVCRIVGLVLCLLAIAGGWQNYKNSIIDIITGVVTVLIGIILGLLILGLIIFIITKLNK